MWLHAMNSAYMYAMQPTFTYRIRRYVKAPTSKCMQCYMSATTRFVTSELGNCAESTFRINEMPSIFQPHFG